LASNVKTFLDLGMHECYSLHQSRIWEMKKRWRWKNGLEIRENKRQKTKSTNSTIQVNNN
jgi:hypothetical protein